MKLLACWALTAILLACPLVVLADEAHAATLSPHRPGPGRTHGLRARPKAHPLYRRLKEIGNRETGPLSIARPRPTARSTAWSKTLALSARRPARTHGRGGRTDHPPIGPGRRQRKAVQKPAPSAQPSSLGLALPVQAQRCWRLPQNSCWQNARRSLRLAARAAFQRAAPFQRAHAPVRHDLSSPDKKRR